VSGRFYDLRPRASLAGVEAAAAAALLAKTGAEAALAAFPVEIQNNAPGATYEDGETLRPMVEFVDTRTGFPSAWIDWDNVFHIARNGGDEPATLTDLVPMLSLLGSITVRADDPTDENGDPLPAFYVVDTRSGYLMLWLDATDGRFHTGAGPLGAGLGDTSFTGVIVKFDPTFDDGTRDYKVHVLAWTRAGPDGYLAEFIFVRSQHEDAPGAWRLSEIWKGDLVSAASAGTSQVEKTTGSQVSGGLMPVEAADLGGLSLDNGEAVFDDSPYGPIGGADIHRNNAPLSVQFSIDGLPVDLPAEITVLTGSHFRLDYAWKGVRPRDPSEILTADEVTLNTDIIEIDDRATYTHQAWCTAQDEFTCAFYRGIWCHNAVAANDVFTHLRRPFARSDGGSAPFTAVETIAIASYNEAAYPTGDDNIPEVPWFEYFHDTNGTFVRQEWSAPLYQAAGGDHWISPELVPDGYTSIKPSNGKVYAFLFPPDDRVTVGSNLFGVMQPGDTVLSTTTVHHSFPRSA
jgi:hypothetical protein